MTDPVRTIIVILTLVAMACPDPVRPMHAQEPIVPAVRPDRNLQVMPKDASPTQILRLMKQITRALGTRCDACHIGGSLNYANDVIPRKELARTMMRMVEQIKPHGVNWLHPPGDVCNSCHKGKLKPDSNPR